jgi:hypothetical protein
MAQGRKPDYNVTYSQTFDNDGEDKKTLVTIGAAWDGQTREGVPCINVKLSGHPWGQWDGSLTLWRTRG